MFALDAISALDVMSNPVDALIVLNALKNALGLDDEVNLDVLASDVGAQFMASAQRGMSSGSIIMGLADSGTPGAVSLGLEPRATAEKKIGARGSSLAWYFSK